MLTLRYLQNPRQLKYSNQRAKTIKSPPFEPLHYLISLISQENLKKWKCNEKQIIRKWSRESERERERTVLVFRERDDLAKFEWKSIELRGFRRWREGGGATVSSLVVLLSPFSSLASHSLFLFHSSDKP